MSPTDATADRPVTPLADVLPDEPATLKSMIVALLATRHAKDRQLDGVRQRLELLLRRLYGPRGERFDPNQPLLFAELAAGTDAAPSVPEASATKLKSKRRCRPHGRRRLPEHLRREPRHHQLSAAERVCPGCGHVRIDIGVAQSEQLDYQPASLFVIEHFVHKYACPCCSKRPPQVPGAQRHQNPESEPMPSPEPPHPSVPAAPEPLPTPGPTAARPEQRAPSPEPRDRNPPPAPPGEPLCLTDPGEVVSAAVKPAMPMAKGLPGAGLLAHRIVSTYVDHLPLHRLERVYERQGLFVHRSTLCDWRAACAQLLRPLYQVLVAVTLQSRALHSDDTTVKIQELITHLLSTARLWAYLGDAAQPYHVFDFTRNRQRDGPQQFLADYQG